MNLNEFQDKIFDISNEELFEIQSLKVFNLQYQNNLIYKQYCDLINVNTKQVNKITEIPFLPIQFFKSQVIKTTRFHEEAIFTSSGTTLGSTSKHFIKNLKVYEKSFLKAFDLFYPNWEQSIIIGLLPSYLERSGSSLIYMVNYLIKNSNSKDSTFQLELNNEFIHFLQNDPNPKIMFGVTFALLEMADKGVRPLNTTIIETGGMKGRGKELTREELHAKVNSKIQPDNLHSEYGMTELLSQAYLKNDYFISPSWMKCLIRDTTDPLSTKKTGKGVLNIIDLANIHSCSFIATEDLGEVSQKGFKVSGRLDHSQIRGCNLLMI